MFMENKLFDLAAKRRSIRRYTNEHISDEVLNEIMKAALTAPCSFGHRPVEFVIVRDKIRELAGCISSTGRENASPLMRKSASCSHLAARVKISMGILKATLILVKSTTRNIDRQSGQPYKADRFYVIPRLHSY